MASYNISLPSMSSLPLSESESSLTQKTNTVAITNIPREYFHPQIINLLKHHFSSFGDINQWVALPGFGRILVVYELEEHAESAKIRCDPIVINGSHDRSEWTLRVYRADRNPIQPHRSGSPTSFVPEANYLRPPAIEKNFLISPPGSPPVGWEPIKEDPPNSTPLADDLIHALQQLSTRERHTGIEVLLDPHDGSGVGVYVENADEDEDEDIAEENWIYGETMASQQRWRPMATSMPPMRAAIIA